MNHLVVQFVLAGPKVGPDAGKASPVGLLLVVLLLIGVFLLVWSMNRHLKRIPESFDPVDEAAAEATTGNTAPATDHDAEGPAA